MAKSAKLTKSAKPGRSGGSKSRNVAGNRFVSALARGWRRALRLIALVVAILIALPIVLTLIYAIEGVKPVSTLMVGRWLTANSVDRQWADFDEIAPALVRSVMVSEDARFCAHGGVDWEELNTVIEDALDGEKTRGASTLAMQTAKNLFLWPGRSYVRKGLELPLALFADLVWSKRRLMEIYLNVAEWDEGVFGVGAAARHYFGRSAARVNARQAALLAVTLPNPKARNPAKPTRNLSRRANTIRARADRSGAYIGCLKEG